MRRFLLLAALAAVACQSKSSGNAPWNTYPGVAGHTWFPLAGTAHEPQPTGSLNAVTWCKDCHPSDSFQKMTDCKTCHFAQVPAPNDMGPHTGNAAYASALATGRTDYCLGCHPQGIAYSGINHTRFPIGAGSKHNRACSVCHTSTTSRNTAIASGTLNCVPCHMNQAPFTGVFPPPTVDLRHLPATLRTGGSGLVEDYPLGTVAPKDCMRCHDPIALAPSAGTGNLVLPVASHGTRSGPSQIGRAGPWDGRHGNSGQPVRCWECHDSVPALFPGASGPSDPDRPWAQDWSIGPPSNSCVFTTGKNTAQTACCTHCHGTSTGN